MTTLLEAALAYAAAGWFVFPCQPQSKVPATPHGFKDATRDEQQIRAWWTDRPDFNVAIATGEISGIFVLDIDHKQGRTLDEAIESLPPIPAGAPTVRTGGGGIQYFLSFPRGAALSISGGRLGLGIDTRGNGGYVVAPPSLHPHGTNYQWIDSDDLTTLPECPGWIVEKLAKQQAGAVALSAERLTGGRHDTLMTAAALMRGIGLVPNEILAALRELRGRLDTSDGRVITDNEIERIATWCGDKSVGRVNIDAVTHGEQVAQDLIANYGSAAAEIASEPDAKDPGPFPVELLDVPGVIEEWTDFINRRSFRQQPVLALAATLVACGALIGRRLETENGGRANIYALGVCETGGGKDSARIGVKEVLCAAGADDLLGPEDFASESGLVSSLVASPVQLCQVDEIGKLLQAIAHPASGSHLVGIVSALLKLYSSAATIYKGKAYADITKNPVIDQPHLCLYGTAVPDQTWAALGAGSVDDGLMARLWVFVPVDHKPRRQPRERMTPPQGLVDTVRSWHMGVPKGLASSHPSPAVVPMSIEAALIFSDLEEEVDVLEGAMGTSPLRKLWTRTSQKAEQLALVYAWSKNPGNPEIDEPCAVWASKLATYLTHVMIYHASRHLAENRTEGDLKKVLRIIQDEGRVGVTLSSLCRRTQWLTKRQREEILTTLVESGQTFFQYFTTSGRPSTVIRAARWESEIAEEVGGVE